MALVVGPLLAVALFVFLRCSSYGIALRAAAENMPRARLLGIPVRRVSTIAWVIAGVLSAIAGILLAPIIGFSATEAVGLPILMRGLAAAMAARMESVGDRVRCGTRARRARPARLLLDGPQRADRPRAPRRHPRDAPRSPRGGQTNGLGRGVVVGGRRAGACPSRRGVARPTLATHGVQCGRDRRRIRPWAPLLLGESATFFLATVLLVSVVAVARPCSPAGPGRCRSASGRSPVSAVCSARSSSSASGIPFWIVVRDRGVGRRCGCAHPRASRPCGSRAPRSPSSRSASRSRRRRGCSTSRGSQGHGIHGSSGLPDDRSVYYFVVARASRRDGPRRASLRDARASAAT